MQPDQNQKPANPEEPLNTNGLSSGPPMQSRLTSPVVQPFPPTSPSPISGPGMIVGGSAPGPVVSPGSIGSTRSKKKRFALLAIVLLLFGGVGSAYYFGVYVPNTPESIWASALTNTGRGYDKLVDYADEAKDFKGFKAKGDFSMDDDDLVIDGSFSAAGSPQALEARVDVGALGERFMGDFRMITPKRAAFPDTYVRLKGFKGITKLLSTSSTTPAEEKYLASLDNQWIVVDHSLFNQLGKAAGAEPTGLAELTNDDYIQIARKVGEVSKQYIFTGNPETAVFTIARKVGKEEKGGRQTYHFSAGYNKAHLKAYLTALKDGLKQTKLTEVVPGGDIEKAIGFKDIMKEAGRLKGTGTADVWVDTKTRLVKAVRFVDDKDNTSYMEFGFDYTGGSDYPFALRYDSGKIASDKAEFTFTLKPKTHSATIKIEATEKTKNPTTLKLHATVTQTNDLPVVAKPKGAKSWTELFGGLLGLYIPSGTYGAECHISAESGTCTPNTNKTVPSVRL